MNHRVCVKLAWVILGGMLVSLSGCAVGPKVLRSARPEYNRVIQQTEQEELLLNIVRLRYGDQIKFLQVASVVSTTSVGASLNGNATFPFDPTGNNVANFGVGANYNDTPTITYVPVEGGQFASQFLSGLSVYTLQSLLQSGWAIDRTLALTAERMGPLVNNPAAATFPQFMELIKIWAEVQARGDIQFVWFPATDTILAEKIPPSAVSARVFTHTSATNFLRYYPLPDGNYQLAQVFDSVVMEVHYKSEEEAERVSALLGDLNSRPKGVLMDRIALIDATIPPNDYRESPPATQLNMNMRSLADMMYSVTAGVAVPPADAAVSMPQDPAATKLLSVQQSGSRPDGAYIATPYRGRWFSIADTDLDSKLNFGLLLSILSLQTNGGGAAPGLSLQVGG